MRTGTSLVVLAGLLAAMPLYAEPPAEQQTMQHTYPLSSPTPRLLVRNIWGNVTVRAGTASEIAVKIHERRTARTQRDLERSKEEIRLSIEATGEAVSMVVADPHRDDGHIDTCEGCRAEYQFEIVAPPGTQIDVATVTDGRVDVVGFQGSVRASNVNGPVTARELRNCAQIDSVNGALDVHFARVPTADCTMETINGRITLSLPAEAGFDALLSLSNGEVESEFDVEPVTLPAKVEKSARATGNVFRLVKPAAVRVGSGGPTFSFASLNGDVHIRKNH